MKKAKKIMIFILSLLVLITLTLSFASCGDNEDDPVSDGSTETQGSIIDSDKKDPVVDDNTGNENSTGNNNTDSGNTGGDNTDNGGDNTPTACTHTITRDSLIKFSDYGNVCGGGVYVAECESCEKVIPYANSLITFCEFENGKCTKCGLEFSKVVNESNCSVTTTLNVSLDGLKILDNASEKKEAHNIVNKMVELDEFTCSVTMAVEKCKDCTLSTFAGVLHEGNELNNTTESSDTKEIKTSQCNECGYKKETTIQKIADCTNNSVEYITLSLYNGENEIYSRERARSEKDHDWKLSAIKCGEGCKDGLFITKECIECGLKEYETAFDHIATTENVDLKDITACGGYMSIEKCIFCDEKLSLKSKPQNCFFALVDSGYDTQTRTMYEEYECVECGIKLSKTINYEFLSSCSTLFKEAIESSKDEDAVLSTQREYIERHHSEYDYEYTYETMGETCLEGLIRIGVCNECGDTKKDTIYSNGHYLINYKTTELNTPCGGEISSEECACGRTKYFYNGDYCSMNVLSEGEEEIDGIIFETKTYACSFCGTEYISKVGEKVDGCVTHKYRQKCYKYNGEIIFDSGVYESDMSQEHDEKLTVIALGTSCIEDGVLIRISCNNCDYRYYALDDYHEAIVTEIIDLTEYGACGGAINIEECVCDDNVTDARYYRDKCSFEETESETEEQSIYTRVCTECGFTIEKTRKYIYKDCKEIIEEYVVYSIEDATIYEIKEIIDENISHNFETTYRLLKDMCYKGLYEIRKCKDCDYTETEEHYECVVSVDITRDFSDYGVCESSYYYYKNCPCGSLENEYYSLNYCQLALINSNVETIDGVTHEITIEKCENCGVIETRDKYKGMEECEEFEYLKLTVTMGEETLVNGVIRKSFIYARHDYVYSNELLGKSCEDGIKETETCEKCDHKMVRTYYNHNLYEAFQINKVGDCYHSVILYECPCKKEHDLQIFSLEETEDGGYACADCGLVIEKSVEEKKEECKLIETTTRTVYIGSEYQFEVSDIVVYDNHDLEAPIVSNENGKEIVKSTCKSCDFELVQEVYILVFEEEEWGQLSTLDFKVSETEFYTVYTASKKSSYNYIFYTGGYMYSAYYPENEKYPVAIIELEGGEAYTLEASSYDFDLTISAYVMIKGEYYVCNREIDESSIKLTTSDGKYELTLCASCQMILDVQEISE